jgi:polar amino acid transport system substrate-binding protein
MCADVPFPPFEVEDAASPTGYAGFDIDLMTSIAANLGLDLAVVDVDFNALQSGLVLQAKNCDIAASALTITEERKNNLDFSNPYYDSLQTLLVPADSTIASLEDLKDKKLAVQTGSSGIFYAQDNVDPSTTLVEFPGDGEMWLALQGGTVDAMLFDKPVNFEHTQTDPNFKVSAEFDTGEQYGFAVAKGTNAELLAAVNEQLAVIQSDGTYDGFYVQYFGEK